LKIQDLIIKGIVKIIEKRCQELTLILPSAAIFSKGIFDRKILKEQTRRNRLLLGAAAAFLCGFDPHAKRFSSEEF